MCHETRFDDLETEHRHLLAKVIGHTGLNKGIA